MRPEIPGNIVIGTIFAVGAGVIAFSGPGRCTVVTDGEEWVFRHELAHCNGWTRTGSPSSWPTATRPTGRGTCARRTCERWRAAMNGPRVVVAAGGTAGHVVPAIAVADALRAEGADVRFAGGERAEAELVPAAGYEIDQLNVEGISRSNPLKAVRAVVKSVAALGSAARLLRRHLRISS